jgi:hypothetical protein
MTPEEMQAALVEEEGVTPDEAADMLLDMGEIDEDDHGNLLSYEAFWEAYG